MRNLLYAAVAALLALALAPGAGCALDLDPNDLSLEFVTNVTDPTAIANAGDERLFLVEQAGRILIYTHEGGLNPTPFLDIQAIVEDGFDEAGLLSVAFHPAYAQNRTFFVAYTKTASPVNVVLARYRASVANPDIAEPNGVVLLDVAKSEDNHNGGQIAFREGHLYMTFGDGGGANDPSCFAQRGDTLLGKMVRLEVDPNDTTSPFYDIPLSNPFANPNDGIRNEIWALGLRNAWRFSFDRLLGDLYIADVGQGALEEIDLESAGSIGGENYGWKVMEGTSCTTAFPDPDCPLTTPVCNSPALTLPVHEYPNDAQTCSVIGGYVYRGAEIGPLQGIYLFGDYCTAEINALEETAPDEFQEVPLLDPNDSLRTFGEDAAGEVYVGLGTGIYRLAYDVDGDGIPGLDDNCPYVANAGQQDTGGIGTATPDGIGNVCQCGDVTNNGIANGQDGTFITRHGLGYNDPPFLDGGKCDVNGNGLCNGQDGTLTTRAGLGYLDPLNVAPRGQNCHNANPAAPPCSTCSPCPSGTCS